MQPFEQKRSIYIKDEIRVDDSIFVYDINNSIEVITKGDRWD